MVGDSMSKYYKKKKGRIKVFSRNKRDKLWMEKSRKERTVKGTIYENPAKLIGNDVFQLADIFPYEKGETKEQLIDDLKERYDIKKEDMGIKYRIFKRKYHAEIWRTYN